MLSISRRRLFLATALIWFAAGAGSHYTSALLMWSTQLTDGMAPAWASQILAFPDVVLQLPLVTLFLDDVMAGLTWSISGEIPYGADVIWQAAPQYIASTIWLFALNALVGAAIVTVVATQYHRWKLDRAADALWSWRKPALVFASVFAATLGLAVGLRPGILTELLGEHRLMFVPRVRIAEMSQVDPNMPLMSVSGLRDEYGLEVPSWAPDGYELIEELGNLSEFRMVSGKDVQSIQVFWSNDDNMRRQIDGMFVNWTHIYLQRTNDLELDEVGPEDVYWQDANGDFYFLYTNDDEVSVADLKRMACTMPSYDGACDGD